jgi:hypothetical protein
MKCSIRGCCEAEVKIFRKGKSCKETKDRHKKEKETRGTKIANQGDLHYSAEESRNSP